MGGGGWLVVERDERERERGGVGEEEETDGKFVVVDV